MFLYIDLESSNTVELLLILLSEYSVGAVIFRGLTWAKHCTALLKKVTFIPTP